MPATDYIISCGLIHRFFRTNELGIISLAFCGLTTLSMIKFLLASMFAVCIWGCVCYISAQVAVM